MRAAAKKRKAEELAQCNWPEDEDEDKQHKDDQSEEDMADGNKKTSRKGKGKGRGRGGTKGKGRGRGRGLAKKAPNFQVAGTSAAPEEPEPALEEEHETPSEGKKAHEAAKPGKVMPESKQKKSPKSEEPKSKKAQEPLGQDSNEARSSAVSWWHERFEYFDPPS